MLIDGSGNSVEEDLDLLLREGKYYYDTQNFRKAMEKFEKVVGRKYGLFDITVPKMRIG